jgi:hypothetical protein
MQTGWPIVHCRACHPSAPRTVGSSARLQLWCMIWLWSCIVQIKCRGSLGASSLSRGLKLSRSSLEIHTSKYWHVNYMTYIIPTYSIHDLHFFSCSTIEDSCPVFHSMGQHTEESYIMYLWWFRPHACFRITFTEMDPDIHLRTMQDTFPHHHMEGIVGLVS